jgi:polysaccharide deacetylase 2 family uncharacterized protein YibQ
MTGAGLPLRARPVVAGLVAGLVAVGLIVVGVAGCSKSDDDRSKAAGRPGSSFPQRQAEVERVLARHAGDAARATLDTAGGRSWPLPAVGAKAAVRCRVVAVPAPRDPAALIDALREPLAAAGAGVLWQEPLGRGAWRLDVGLPGQPTHTLALVPPNLIDAVRWSVAVEDPQWRELVDGPGPLVALVIDDWGQRLGGPPAEILDVSVPLTLAVLPGLPRSREIAALATPLVLPAVAAAADTTGVSGEARRRRRAAGCPVEVRLTPAAVTTTARREIFLHLPMQPLGSPGADPGPDALLIGMEAAAVVERLDRALRSVPGASGVNNHMGSAATADPALMGTLMAELSRRGLRFLDSLTSPRSVAWQAARSAGVPALRNRLFLDVDHQDEAAITARLAELIAVARARGQAVGIGHPHAATAAVLARELPRYAAEGVRFVTVSELIALRPVGASRTGETTDGR